MNKFILLVCFFGLSYGLQAQVPHDKVKSNDYIENKFNRPGRVSGLQVTKIKSGENCIVVIDNKIYNGNAEELHNIPKESIELIRSIQDTSSSAEIKCILIYKSKPKAI